MHVEYAKVLLPAREHVVRFRQDAGGGYGQPVTLFDLGDGRLIGEPEYVRQAMRIAVKHHWNAESCSCGQDVVTCQVCGRLVCGSLTKQVKGRGNVCPACQMGD